MTEFLNTVVSAITGLVESLGSIAAWLFASLSSASLTDSTLSFIELVGGALVVTALLITLAALLYRHGGRVGGRLGLLRARMPGFNRNTVLLTAAVLGLEFALWYSGTVPVVFHWPWIILNLLVASFLLYLGAHKLDDDRRLYAAFGVATAACVLFATVADDLYTPSPEQESASAPVHTLACGGPRFVHHYGMDRGESLYADGCRVDLWYSGHCVYVQRAGSTLKIGPFCDTNGAKVKKSAARDRLPGDIQYAWSADSAPFDDYARLVTTPFRSSSR